MESTAIEPIQTTAQRPHPQAPGIVLENWSRFVRRHPFACCIRGYLPIRELIEPVLGAGPKSSLAIHIKRQNQTVRQAVAHAIYANFAVPEAADAPIGPDP